MPKPNKDRLALAVEALRSGEFEQTSGALCSVTGPLAKPGYRYCCLGVLTEVAMRNGVNVVKDHCAPDPVTYSDPDSREVADSALLRVVRDWYGLDDIDPLIEGDHGHRAIFFNDDRKETFPQIADRFWDFYRLGVVDGDEADGEAGR